MVNHVQIFPLAVVAAVALLGSGCVMSKSTVLEQEESFKPYGKLSVRGESIRNYAMLRTAGLFSGESLDLQEFQNELPSEGETALNGTIHFKPGAKQIAVGSAAAVDRRGYFVTAAHCIEDDGVGGQVYLVFPGSKAEVIMKTARVVWSGRGLCDDGLDFAVLKIESPLTNVFDWGPLPEADDPVLGVGVSNKSGSLADSVMAPFSGEVLAVSDRQKSRSDGVLIRHESPLRQGNSGGPLINQEGQLLGVNFAQASSVQALLWRCTPGSYAARPDIEWLAELIEQDYAALSGKKNGSG